MGSHGRISKQMLGDLFMKADSWGVPSHDLLVFWGPHLINVLCLGLDINVGILQGHNILSTVNFYGVLTLLQYESDFSIELTRESDSFIAI